MTFHCLIDRNGTISLYNRFRLNSFSFSFWFASFFAHFWNECSCLFVFLFLELHATTTTCEYIIFIVCFHSLAIASVLTFSLFSMLSSVSWSSKWEMGLSLSNSLLELKCDRWYLFGDVTGGSVGDVSFFARIDFLRFAAAEIFFFQPHRKIENNKNLN